ncbi:MAG TPA: ribonuclease HII, partial [Lactobacillus sp.]|nr:ribonuclease HII [Lactobacillus sp.]
MADTEESVETKVKRPSIAELKRQLAHVERADDPLMVSLADDPRKGVVNLLAQTKRRLTAQAHAETAFDERLQIERACWANG